MRYHDDDNDVSVAGSAVSFYDSADYPLSLLHLRANSLIQHVEAIENMSRRRRQESNAVDAIDDLGSAPVECLEGMRTMSSYDNEKSSINGNECDLLSDSALADDLSSCADDDLVSYPTEGRQYLYQDNSLLSEQQCNNLEYERLQNRLKACYQSVISIQATADLRERRLELEVIRLQNEIEIERCRNTQLSAELENVRQQSRYEGEKIDEILGGEERNNEVALDTLLSSLGVRCQKYLSENMILKDTLRDSKHERSKSIKQKDNWITSSTEVCNEGHKPDPTHLAKEIEPRNLNEQRIDYNNIYRQAIHDIHNVKNSMENYNVLEGGECNDYDDCMDERSIDSASRRPTYQSLSQKILRNYVLSSHSTTASTTASTTFSSTGSDATYATPRRRPPSYRI